MPWFIRWERNSSVVPMPYIVRYTIGSSYNNTICSSISGIMMNSYGTVHSCLHSMVQDAAYCNVPVPRCQRYWLNLLPACNKNVSACRLHRRRAPRATMRSHPFHTSEKRVSCAAYKEAKRGWEQFFFRTTLPVPPLFRCFCCKLLFFSFLKESTPEQWSSCYQH